MNKKQLFIKLLIIVVGGIGVFLLSSCFTSIRLLSCKRSCMESCSTSTDDDISGHEYGIYYSLSNDGESYFVSEVGYYETYVVIPETYEGKPVTGIEGDAFSHFHYGSGCGGNYPLSMTLSSLTLPKTIKVIERGAFNYYYGAGATCDKVIYEGTAEGWLNIEFGSSVFSAMTKLYVDGEELTDLVVPESVTKIKENAFAYYGGLRSVTLHENVTEIETNAFNGCDGLEEVTLPCKDLTIGESAFESCLKLTELDFTGEKLALGDFAFAHCVRLSEVNWNSVEIKIIPHYAFLECTGLDIFVIPAPVETIESEAFNGCNNIMEVVNLSKLKVVAGSTAHGGVAFYAGAVYTAEEEASRILTVGDYKFVVGEEKTTLFRYTGEDEVLFLPEMEGGYDIRANTFANNYKVTTVKIPECVTEIGNNAFYYCENLRIVIGCDGVLTVGTSAFNGCTWLASIQFAKVEKIGYFAFANCRSLQSLYLPKTLTEVGKDAFVYSAEEITYAGTLEEWNNIKRSEYGTTVKVTCSDGEVWEGTI